MSVRRRRLATLAVVLGGLLVTSAAQARQAVAPGTAQLLAGDHDAAETRLSGCLATQPADLHCAVGLAALREARGDVDGALSVLSRGLSAAPRSPLAPGAMARVAMLAARASDGGALAEPLLREVISGVWPHGDPEVRSIAALALADVLARSGRADESLAVLRGPAGRIRTWSLLGAYGRIDALAFDRRFPPEDGDLDPSDDGIAAHRAPHRIDTSFADGRIIMPDALARGGAVYAAVDVVAERRAGLRLRITCQGSHEAFFDGESVLRVDRRRHREPLASSLLVDLDPGRHRLIVKAVGANRYPSISVAAEVAEGETPEDAGLRFEHPRGFPDSTATIRAETSVTDTEALADEPSDPHETLSHFWWLRARGRARDAGELLRRAHARWPDAPLFALALGEFYIKAETGAAPEEDLALARGLLETAVAADPALSQARLLLADMERGTGHEAEAWEMARQVVEGDPTNVDALLLLHDLAARRGWETESTEFIEQAYAAAPGRTDVLRAAIEHYARIAARDRLRPLLAEEHRRYPTEERWADLMTDEGNTEAALEAWDVQIAARPTGAYAWLGKVRALMDADRLDEAERTLRAAAEIFPRESWISNRLAGVLALQGRTEEADRALERTLALDPSRLELRRTLAWRGVLPDLLSRWLVDPEQVLAGDHRRSGTDSALLADIAATLVDASGGQTELYQGMHRVYTRAGVEHEGELQILPGSIIDRIRVYKPDRRIVDVEPGRRRPVSIPGLEPNDAFEYVLRRYSDPLRAVDGALDNGTIFLFQGDDRDYVLSRYAIVHREDLPIEVCGNQSGLEATDTVEDGWRIRSWTAEGMPRQRVEPHIPDRFEITPYIRLGMRLSWEDLGDVFKGTLIGKQRPDPPIPEMLEEIRTRAGSDEPEALARAMHELIGERIEPGRSPLSLQMPASVAASAGEGNRAGVALALAEALGLDAALVFTRPMELAGTALDCPTAATFPFVLVRIALPNRDVYLDYTEADHPFDTIPSRLAGSDGLLVSLDTSERARIIHLPTRETPTLQEQVCEMRLGSDGRVAGRIEMLLRGPFASVLRRLLREVPSDRLPLVYQSLAGDIFPGARVLDASVEGLDESEADLVVRLEIEDGSLARRTPSGFALPAMLQPLGIAPEFASLPRREHPLLFNMQAFRRDEIRVSLPPGLELEGVYEPYEIDGAWGRYRLAARIDGAQLVLERLANLPAVRVEVDEYAAFREFALGVDRAESGELMLEVRSPSLSR